MAATSPAVPPAVVPTILAVFDGNGLALPQAISANHLADESSLVELQYLSEGGANVIYTVRPVATSANGSRGLQLPERLRGKVLRLRKDQEGAQEGSDLEPYVPTAEIESYFYREIATRLPKEHLLQHDLITIQRDLLEACNASLSSADDAKTRPKRRMADRLRESEPHALLLEDMRPEPGVTFTIEFKPKWLSDAPNPGGVDRKRCRTCALRAMRDAEKEAKPGNAYRRAFCPLALTASGAALSENVRRILRSSGIEGNQLWADHGDRIEQEVDADFSTGRTRAILTELAALEKALDPYGSLAFVGHQEREPAVFENLGLAMTLRDCTIFARLDWGARRPLEVRLADLDRKDWRTRWERWRLIEENLVGGGWYAGTEAAGSSNQQEEICVLWR